MKHFLLTFIALITGLSFSLAQAPGSVQVPVNNNSIPTSPGFILLDESPTIIDHPASPKAFAAALYNTYQQTGGFPSNYGVEFAPFWYFKHPGMTAYRFMGYDKANAKQLPFSHIKKASFSLAYVNSPDTMSDAGISNISLGVRTTLVSVRSKKNIDDLQSANEAVIKKLKDLNNIIGALDPLANGYREKVQAIIDNFENDAGLLEAEKLLNDQLEVKPIFAINAAFAYSTFFLNNKVSDNHFGRLGIWAVLNYNQQLGRDPATKNYVSVYGIFRFLRDGTIMDSQETYLKTNNLDFGAKAEMELNKLSLAVEYIFRNPSGEVDNTYRCVGLVNYRISQSFALTASFGRNFGNDYNLVTLFGVNFGLNSGNEEVTIKD